MGKSLRSKLMFGALGVVFLVCIAIIIVVSFIISRQNIQAVERDLLKARKVCQIELDEQQQQFAKGIDQMIIENEISSTVKFLHDFYIQDLIMTESSYRKASAIFMNKAMASNMSFLAAYDISGALQFFTIRNDKDSYLFGFYRKPDIYINQMKKGETIDGDGWTKKEKPSDFILPVEKDAAAIKEESVSIIDMGGKLSIQALVPVFKSGYDADGKSVQKQYGIVYGVKEIEKGFVDRLHLLTGKAVNVFSGSKLSMGQLNDFNTVNLKDINGKNGENKVEEVQLGGGKYYLTVLPTHNQDAVTGAIALLESDAIVKNNTYQMIRILIIVCLICLVLIVPLLILFSKSIVKPLLHIVDRMRDIAEGDGDLRGRITVTAKDEIGLLAENFNTFVEKIQTMVSQVKDNLDLLNASSSDLSGIASTLAAGAQQSSDKANGVASAGEEMSSNMNSIAATMEQAATNISTVSSNAGHMSESIQNVKENSISARDISNSAVEQANMASKKVGELGKAATEIKKVVESITDISEQVNLLSLNATIEAARAGEAGKGFAVVANEIKTLANQTAAASDEIKLKVTDIQNSTEATVKEIRAITKVNNEINEIVQLTAEKVEDQSVSTADIAENVSQASLGISEVNESVSQSSSVAAEIAAEIADVTQTAEEISSSSAKVESSAAELSNLSEKLKTIVDRFKV